MLSTTSAILNSECGSFTWESDAFEMLVTEMLGWLNNSKHRSLDNYNCQDSFLMLPCWQPRTSLPPVHCPAAAKLIMLWIQNKTVWLLRVSTQLSLQRPGAHTHLARVRTGASAGVRKLGLIYFNLQHEKATWVLNDKIVASRLCPVGQQWQESWIAGVCCVVRLLWLVSIKYQI